MDRIAGKLVRLNTEINFRIARRSVGVVVHLPKAVSHVNASCWPTIGPDQDTDAHYEPSKTTYRMFQQQKPRIAIIGSGITGVSAACQVLDAGLECRIFEAQDERSVGGIWARQNATSSIQIPSDFYTFHPKVQWSSEYPRQAEVLHQTRRLWDLYQLESMTFFNCPVTNVERFDGRYVINEKTFGAYDAIIVAVGTCARLSIPEIPGRDDYCGQAVHSSDLGSVDMAGKRVLIIGGGASTVEAMEHAHSSGAASVTVITRVCLSTHAAFEKWLG